MVGFNLRCENCKEILTILAEEMEAGAEDAFNETKLTIENSFSNSSPQLKWKCTVYCENCNTKHVVEIKTKVTVESECELLDFEVPNTNLEDALKIWDEE
jgi:hypothetical protein